MELILLTGARGRVGSLLASFFEKDGFEVRPIEHDPSYSKYVLPTPGDVSNFNRIIVVHSGQPSAPRTRTRRKNYLNASRDLIEGAIANNFEFVFISSLSAHDKNRSNYSRDKLALERLTISNSGNVIKLGIVTEISLSYALDIRRIEDLFSKFRLAFLFSSANIYFTRGATLRAVSLLVRDSPSNGETKSYTDAERLSSIATQSFWVQCVKSLVVASLISLSRLGNGQADALLNLVEGMRIPS